MISVKSLGTSHQRPGNGSWACMALVSTMGLDSSVESSSGMLKAPNKFPYELLPALLSQKSSSAHWNQKSLLLGSFHLYRTSLVVQWLRICLPMQGTQVPFLVREDPTCHVATKPVNHNYWTWCLEPVLYTQWEAHEPQWRVALLAATKESPCVATKTQCNHK